MNTIRVDILNPKALELLKSLADLNLISFNESSEDKFNKVLDKLRKKKLPKMSLEEITKEVESVRSERYEKKSKKGNH